MHLVFLTIIWIAPSIIIAVLGKNRKFGFWGFLFLSIVMTPLVGLIALLASSKPENDEASD